MSIVGLEEGWTMLQREAIDVLQSMLNRGLDKSVPFSPKSYSPIYTMCYEMCTQRAPYNWSEQLYIRHGETIKLYLETVVMPALRERHDAFLLDELVKRWQNHLIMNKWMQRFFMYLDRYYVKHHALPPLHDAGMRLFKSVVYDHVKRDATKAIIVLLEREREGEVVDRGRIRACVEIFEAVDSSLQSYREDFEEPVLRATEEYYRRKSQQWLQSDSVPEYLLKAERTLAQESVRVSQCMNSRTDEQLQAVCIRELLTTHQTTLLEKEGSGMRVLLRDRKREDLARMSRLFQLVPQGLTPLGRLFRDHVEQLGMGIVRERQAAAAAAASAGADAKDATSSTTFVNKLIELYTHVSAMVHEEFGTHVEFQKAMRDAFETFVNKDVGSQSNAELLSVYVDHVLKAGGEKLSDAEIEDTLERAVTLFSFLADKDMFADIYRNLMSKRLLNERSKSDDAERSMISKLKLCCGAQFTSKLEGMLSDLAVGADAKRNFQAHMEDNHVHLPIQFSVQVLTTGFWPSPKPLDVVLPPLMAQCVEAFQSYYERTTNHRRLAWAYSLGNASVRAMLGGKTYDLQVTTAQAVVLLAFNARDTCTVDELMGQLGLTEDVAKRLVFSFACGKLKVLLKTPASKSVAVTDEVTVNAGFKCPMRNIRVPMVSLDSTHNPQKVEEDRTIAIEAAIVRIMKARKVLGHQELVTEVLAQLAFFRPNPKAIKRRIENLIEREYLERDAQQATVYHYLA